MAHSKQFQLMRYTSDREIGKPYLRGTRDALYSRLYSNFVSVPPYDPHLHTYQDWGGIFGFGFSPDGSMLAAACEKRCILMYDPRNAKLFRKRFRSHNDCVNCVSFLDNRIFATCSDDNTVRLWDCRNLKEELRIMRGHTNWVKNIEYLPSQAKLITSGFDGNILAWDINDSTKGHEDLLSIKETMRLKVTRDEGKLLVSTLSGYVLLIHNLDLSRLKEDYQLSKKHRLRYLYKRGSLTENYMSNCCERNQFEYITDFPDQAKSISSMQIHPQNWCIVTRNTTSNAQEWTCVHDIQSSVYHVSKKCFKESSHKFDSASVGAFPFSKPLRTTRAYDEYMAELESLSKRHRSKNITNGHKKTSTEAIETGVRPNTPMSRHTRDHSSTSSALPTEHSTTSSDSTYATDNMTTSSETASQRENSAISTETIASVESSPISSDTFSSSSPDTSSNNSQSSAAATEICDPLIFAMFNSEHFRVPNSKPCKGPRYFYEVMPRRLFQAQEPNVARGFIKEQSFSPDGRIIASPYGNHVRLLAFDENCSEICDNIPKEPRFLRAVGNCALVKSSVLTSIFSPTDCLLVAGARDGSIAFSQPVL